MISHSQNKNFLFFQIPNQEKLGNIQYELNDHLGNVRAIVSDEKISIVTSTSIHSLKPILLQSTDYYAFGSPMPGRTFSASPKDYRFGFNGQEKDDEVYGKGNLNTAEYWEYDTRLGRRWNLEPKPHPSISYYSCFANSPIWFNDLKGDTVNVNFTTERGKEAYDIWANSKAGKIFLKDYGVGGKYQKISVNFTDGVTQNSSANGETDSFIKDKISGSEEPISDFKKYDNIHEVIKGNGDKYLKFVITLKEINKGLWGKMKDKTDPLNYSRAALTGHTILHETQHLRIIHASLLKDKRKTTAYEQHRLMRTESWLNERMSFLKENMNNLMFYYHQFKKDYKNEEEFIKRNANDFFD